ncbi:hypothetical protein Scep_030293 [Stephania cephalantha]|uniref:Oberon PHD finger domain-containing protein n=1 Tax=Stephania cephalantha TaxID=152367 RepID=A0AAP0E3T0_9MAGN
MLPFAIVWKSFQKVDIKLQLNSKSDNLPGGLTHLPLVTDAKSTSLIDSLAETNSKHLPTDPQNPTKPTTIARNAFTQLRTNQITQLLSPSPFQIHTTINLTNSPIPMPKRRLSSSSASNPETEAPEKDGGSEEELRENGILLSPVAGGSAGEGLPYAPVDWPEVGDVWGWKVGKRKTNTGFLMDRYLCLPPRLQASYKTKAYFASKLSVKQFVEREFPDANVDAFFSLFSWKVPSKDHNWGKDPIPISCAYPTAEPYYLESDDGSVLCKARNKMCSLHQEEPSSSLPPIECQICCLEPGFCRNCCCILCSKTIDWANGGYSFVRCEAKLGESHICGHAAHVDCALRSYMAGTVGGNIGLDAEYYCRRCDQKTDLVSHVTKAMKICESLDSQGDIKKILEMGFCILRGSHAKWLLSRIELALRKVDSINMLQNIEGHYCFQSRFS